MALTPAECVRSDQGIWLNGEGQSQLYASLLLVWDDLLPHHPADIAEADARTVAATLIEPFGGRLMPSVV